MLQKVEFNIPLALIFLKNTSGNTIQYVILQHTSPRMRACELSTL